EWLFFSSRRRHTRFSRDWSSDVCSSDLATPLRPERAAASVAGEVAALRAEGHGEQATAEANQHLVEELRRMRSYISQQFSALSWVDGVRRSPVQAQLLRRLIAAGFSARL